MAVPAVEQLSGGTVTLRAGTVYGPLDREEAVVGRLRRCYRLTGDGAAVLTAEITRLRRNAAAAEDQLRRRPATGFAYGG
jgi:PadR family transcriptional regulator, regulatory protein PadR